MFHDEVFGFCLAQRAPNRRPIHDTMARVRPAILIRILAGRRDVLDVEGDDAVAIPGDPFGGVLARPFYPADIRLPQQGRRALEDQVEREQAIGGLGEFEIVIVPGEPDPLG